MPATAPEIKKWAIYMIANPENQVYVGRSSDLKGRLQNYRTLHGRTHKQPLLYESLVKFGFDSHTVKILDSFESDKEYAEGKEIFWIKSFMSNVIQWPDQKGLNKTRGGQGSIGLILSEEHKKRIGDKLRGVPLTEETKRKLSISAKESAARYWLGKKIPQEVRDKMSLAKKGNPSPHKGTKKSTEAILNNSMSKLGKPNLKLRGRKMPPRKPINTKKQPVLLFSDTGEFIRELKSKREAQRVLVTGKSIVENLLKGFLGGKLNGFIIKLK